MGRETPLRSGLGVGIAVLASWVVGSGPEAVRCVGAEAPAAPPVASDANADGVVDISDPIAVLGWLFLGGPPPVPATCESGLPDRANGDSNADGTVDLSDAVHILAWLFGGGPAPASIVCPAPLPPCLAALEASGVAWSHGPESPGVAAPVIVTQPIAGIRYRSEITEQLRDAFFMDCELALALVAAAEVLSAHGVVEVRDLGVYSYRCIGGGTPPDCPGGISLHANALAIDIAALVDAEGTIYSVERDWVIDADEQTCADRPRDAADALLHDVVCDLHSAGVFRIYLTPNYNEDHRNHWHLDLSPIQGSFIQ